MDLFKYSFNKTKFKTRLFLGLIIISAFILGFILSDYLAIQNTRKVISTIRPVRENNFNYKYIYPLLGYDFAETRPYLENKDLTNKIKNLVQKELLNGKAEKISVYFRNFNSTAWAGVNQEAAFHPGSLLKVLIMIGYFRESELNPSLANRTFVYTEDINKQAHALPFSMPTSLEVGKSYTVSYLMEEMIAKSDNGAETLLINNVDRKILNDAYTDLNIQNPDSYDGDYVISPFQYVAFLRILYNSTYLNEKDSETALGIMIKSTFSKGLVSGVPENIPVANKYGERIAGDGKIVESIELHDCGIIYSDSPYSLCIMTKGHDEDDQAMAIKEISKLVYDYIK